MNYVIFDLEWNSTYSKKHKKYLNEIIEIGAIKLDSGLEVIDTFSCLIHLQVAKTLQEFVTEMTSITNKDLSSNGINFSKAYAQFKKWVGEEETLFLSWSITDMHVLLENIQYFGVADTVTVMHKYIDLQKYFQKQMNLPKTPQVSLMTAYEMIEEKDAIDKQLHRALHDCYISLACFKYTFSYSNVQSFIVNTNQDFYQRLAFKNYYIQNIHHPNIDRTKLACYCGICKARCTQKSQWKLKNKAFAAAFFCNECKINWLYKVRFKQCYDHVSVSQNLQHFGSEKDS